MRPVDLLQDPREHPQIFPYILPQLSETGKKESPGINVIPGIIFVISVPKPNGATTKVSEYCSIGVCFLERRVHLLFSFPQYLLLPLHVVVFGFFLF